MLTSLCIQNFTTVEAIELDFQRGLTSITGETGAGKSVLLDALALALGGRANREALRDSSSPAEVSASFSFDKKCPMPADAQEWLAEAELLDENEQGDLLLRRVLRPDGRSKSFINGRPVTLADLQKLGEQLVDLHSQHEYQSLLKRSTQQQLLDDYAGNQRQRETVGGLAQQWQAISREIETLASGGKDLQAQRQLLQYQVQELDTLAPQADEVTTLESEQKRLSQAENLLSQLQLSQQLLQNDDNRGAIDLARQALQQLSDARETLPELRNCTELLDSALIQLDEALTEVEQAKDKAVLDPERLSEVDARLEALYDVARKHQVNPEQVSELHETLSEQLAALENSDQRLAELEQEKQTLLANYQKACAKLRKSRETAARKLQKAIVEQLAALNLAHCNFAVQINQHDPEQVSANGSESVEFLIATLPGKPPAQLAKIASGGELSRISLAIQVVTAQTSNTPTVVFDEVDVGIGGGTAEVVGRLLRQLGDYGQVICVTHQAQVAARGHQHLLVSKQLSKKSAHTQFDLLNPQSRKQELARMLGGIELTESTLAHAEEILNSA